LGALCKAPRRVFVAYVAAVATLLASVLGAVQVEASFDLKPAPDDYNLPAWELRHFGNRWLFDIGSLFRDDLSVEDENVLVRRFFELTDKIDDLERALSDTTQRGQGPDEARVADLLNMHTERDRIENTVESVIEGRVSAVLASEGIERDLLLSTRVWPPVDFEFTQSPRNLVISPRDHIELKDTSLLRENLDLDEVERIEDETEQEQGVSALSFATGGIGAYPTLVQYTDNYRSLLELVAHEWTHNYLVFSPLGFNYYGGSQLRAMNETVADLVGHEVAAAVIARWPLDNPQPQPALPPVAAATPAPATQRTQINVIDELRKLRTEVDVLLADGKIDEAETLMEQRRQYLADNGYYMRKINQAYFAFTNLYAGGAGNPTATNPIGPKIDQLRARAGSLERFIQLVQGVTSVEGLDLALESVGGEP